MKTLKITAAALHSLKFILKIEQLQSSSSFSSFLQLPKENMDSFIPRMKPITSTNVQRPVLVTFGTGHIE